jgi:hypothetical protein
MLESVQPHVVSPKRIPLTSIVSGILYKTVAGPACGWYSVSVWCSGVDVADELCMAGREGDCGRWFTLSPESRRRQSMTSYACAKRALLCGSGVDISATRYLRAPRTETGYARLKLDEIRTSVVPNERLSKAKRNISAGEGRNRSNEAG